MKSLSRFTRLFMLVLIVLLLVAPSVRAQDVDTPSPDTVTLEATAVETLSSTIVPTEIATEAPTAEPTATPVPVPPPPAPTPLETVLANINWTLLFLALGLGLFGLIAYAFRLIALSVPLAVYEGGKAAIRANYPTVDRIVDDTIDPTDNVLWKMFHDKMEEQFNITDKLRQEMGQLKQTVANNKVQTDQQLNETAQALSQQITASAAPPS